jgi:ZIP family zinc transporter
VISIGAIVDPAVVSAFLWGAVAASSLLLGGWLACRCTIGRRTLGLLMGFGAGTLLSAVSLELVFESLQRSRGSGYPAIGFFAGAFTFFFGDKLIEIFDLRHRQRLQGRRSEPGASSSLVIPMILGIVLDGVPESMVIGLGRLEHTGVSVAMLVTVLLSNLPEAIAGTVGMKVSG